MPGHLIWSISAVVLHKWEYGLNLMDLKQATRSISGGFTLDWL